MALNEAKSKIRWIPSVDTPVTFGFRDETAERPGMAHSVSQAYLHISPPQVIDCHEGATFKYTSPMTMTLCANIQFLRH
ncbi:hypothetical protein [Shewanella spartinae]|uniref:hypothetical protein n=1 Tax=Shewanella spartinae TaxID=2864205 RepID=UPI001C655362|nr:hypothetical protein [Shewanella spartinae]QYJ93205.1 hypothetical protein K0I31_16670 [Shewanella spartinae]